MSTFHDIIRFPAITEKNTNLRIRENKYVFEVEPTAKKPEIRRAVESLFKVKVESVHTLHVTGKKKRMGKYSGFRPDWKKAIVKVVKGETIKEFGGV